MKTIAEKAYEKYQLIWMIEHSHSLREIFKIFLEAEEENKKYDISDEVMLYAKNYFEEQGFGGEIFVCFGEFLDNEYKDTEFMYHLLSKEEFFEYLRDMRYEAFERFTVDDYGIVTVSESNYMTDDSVTDNPEETSRIVECSGATFSLHDLSGDYTEEDDDLILGVFDNCKEYIEDVTDKQLLEHVYEWFSRDGVHVGDYADKNLKAGEYIKLF